MKKLSVMVECEGRSVLFIKEVREREVKKLIDILKKCGFTAVSATQNGESVTREVLQGYDEPTLQRG